MNAHTPMKTNAPGFPDESPIKKSSVRTCPPSVGQPLASPKQASTSKIQDLLMTLESYLHRNLKPSPLAKNLVPNVGGASTSEKANPGPEHPSTSTKGLKVPEPDYVRSSSPEDLMAHKPGYIMLWGLGGV